MRYVKSGMDMCTTIYIYIFFPKVWVLTESSPCFRWIWPAGSGVKPSTVPYPARRRFLSLLCPASCSFCPSSSTWATSFTLNKRNASSYTVSNQLNSPIITHTDFFRQGLRSLSREGVWRTVMDNGWGLRTYVLWLCVWVNDFK